MRRLFLPLLAARAAHGDPPLCSSPASSCPVLQESEPGAAYLLQRGQRAVRVDSQGRQAFEPADGPAPATGPCSKLGINLSMKWMSRPLPADAALSHLAVIQRHLGLPCPIQRVKTFDLSPTNTEVLELLASNRYGVKELVVGIGNLELASVDVAWLQRLAQRFEGVVHVAVGNEPDREGVPGELVRDTVLRLRQALPAAQLTVPFAYSVMGRSYPVERSEFQAEFLANFGTVLGLLDYFTINVYPFLSAGTRRVELASLTGPGMPFLRAQLQALRVALRSAQVDIGVVIGETGWPSCGAARWRPYNHAVLSHSQEYLRNVAHWIAGQSSDDEISAGFLFTAFDEESKGTREVERHYGVLASDGSVKTLASCASNATELPVAWLEEDYPDCESDLDWMVRNFESAALAEKFANRGLDGSLCAFQQYLSDRWGSCPPLARVPGKAAVFDGAQTAYGLAAETTKCDSPRLAGKYKDRGPFWGPARYNASLPWSLEEKDAPVALAVSAARPLPAFWINLEASHARRVAMEGALALLPGLAPRRVPAVAAEEAMAAAGNGSLRVSAALIERCTLPCPQHHQRNELLATELAVTLSHLRALEAALAAGAEVALILEDDARPRPELAGDLPGLLSAAPAGWEALQLSTVSSKALLALASTGQAFLPWQPGYWGAGAYLVSRQGMRRLVEAYKGREFRAETAAGLQAEALLFGALQRVHSSARFYVELAEFPTTVHLMSNRSEYRAVSSLGWQRHFLRRHAPSGRERRPLDALAATLPLREGAGRPKVLAMTTLVCRRNPSFFGELASIARSVGALQHYGFNWTIFAVVHKLKHRRPCPGLQRYEELARPEVTVAFRESPGRFSKWVYYTEDIDAIDRYDFLLVYDADMGLSTFNWEAFFGRYVTYADRWSAAPVAGIVRNSTPFSPLRSDWWQDCGREGVQFVEADFVEQWFALLSASFAAWFLRRVVQAGLIAVQKSLGVDWGVDAAWCGAAAEWAGKEAGCLLVPMDMYHGDTKSLKQDVTFHKRGEHLTNLWWERLPRWMAASELWLGTFFQDPGLRCSPCGLEERYHMPPQLRTLVPIVPTGPPGPNLHLEEADGAAEASGAAFAPLEAPRAAAGRRRPMALLLLAAALARG